MLVVQIFRISKKVFFLKKNRRVTIRDFKKSDFLNIAIFILLQKGNFLKKDSQELIFFRFL